MRKITIILASLALVLVGAAAAQAGPTASFTITSSISKTRLNLGEQITVTGQVSPASSSKVSIYVQYPGFLPGEYQLVGTDQLNSRSKYTKTFTPAFSGPSKVMVVKEKSSTRSAASTKKSFGTYADFPLSRFTRTVLKGTVTAGTVQYTADAPGTGGYLFSGVDSQAALLRVSVSGKCSRFFAGSGVDLDSPLGTEGVAKVYSATTTTGKSLTALPQVTAVRGDEPRTQNLPLEKLVDGKTVAAYYLFIRTDVDRENGAWGIAQGEVRCNLAGQTILG